MTTLEQLQQWYQSHCNEDWEQQYGITIETIDNPGWSIEVDLMETELEGKSFDAIDISRPETDWMKCWVEDEKYVGMGAPSKLDDILRTFLRWAHDNRGT